jgi:hypothetical protein
MLSLGWNRLYIKKFVRKRISLLYSLLSIKNEWQGITTISTQTSNKKL